MRLLAPFALLAAVLGATLWIDDEPPRADLVLVNRSEVFTLDPQRMSWLQDFRMAYAVYEGLVAWDTRDFSIEPAAAGSWERSDDGLQYAFALRPDARWSDGGPVTAHDFVYAWRRAILPDTAADYTNLFFLIEGARGLFDWRSEALARHAREAAGLPAAERGRRAAELWDETLRRFEATVGLAAADDRTLRVRLSRPVPYFLDLAAFGAFRPVHRPAVEGWPAGAAAAAAAHLRGWAGVEPPPLGECRFVSLDPDTGRLHQDPGWTKPGAIVVNGPYVPAHWRYRRGLHLERNPRYRGASPARCETVACLSIEDVNTAIIAYESGRVDWLTDVSAEYQADMLEERREYERRHAAAIEAARAQGRGSDEALAALPPPRRGERRDIHVFPAFGTDFFSFNCRPRLPGGGPNPFADARVRRAFVAAVDRRMIVERVTRLHEPVLEVFIPPGSIPGYRSPRGLGHDPAAARAALAEAGWADRDGDGTPENASGEEFPVVDLLYSTNTPRYKNISLALRDMWRRELGVKVELRGKENKFFKEDLKTGNFMIGRGTWYGDYGDPTTFLEIFRTGDGNNDRGYANPAVDALLDRAAAEIDPEARFRILEECERLLFQEEVPMLVLCQLVQVFMYEPGRLRGLSHHPRLVQYLADLEVARP